MHMHYYMSSGLSSKDDYSTSLFRSGFTRGATCFKILMNNLMFCPQLSKRYLGARHGERREKNNNFLISLLESLERLVHSDKAH